MKKLNYVEGVVRSVVGFSKIPDEDGDRIMEVEYLLKPIETSLLRQIFNVESVDQGKLDLIDPVNVNTEQARVLQKYVVDGVIDTDKYHFEMHCWQDPHYDWSNGYPIKTQNDDERK